MADQPRKTLGQIIVERQIADGMTAEERKFYNESLARLAYIRSDFEWGFLRECEEKGIKPTIFRYKKHLKKKEDALHEFRKNFKKYRE